MRSAEQAEPTTARTMGQDTSFSRPSARALDTMAHAVRRARESPQEADVRSRPRRRSRLETLLRTSVVVVSALVVGFAGALAALQLRGAQSSPSADLGETGVPRSHAGQSQPTASSVSHASPRSATHSSPRSGSVQTGKQRVLPGSQPWLFTVIPSVAASGQVLTISGANFFSPDGRVQASVGGHDAPTRCPTEAVCVVTVPQDLGPPRRLSLTIETETGTSNTLFVSYK